MYCAVHTVGRSRGVDEVSSKPRRKEEMIELAKMQEEKTDALPEEGETQFGQKTIAGQRCS